MQATEQKIKKFLEERGWDKLRPADLAKSIMIEGGELLELFQWENLSLDEVKNNAEKMAAIKKELADVFIYAFDMAVLLDLSVEEIVAAKLAKAAEKYPAEVMRQGTQGTSADQTYWQIKDQHRRQGS